MAALDTNNNFGINLIPEKEKDRIRSKMKKISIDNDDGSTVIGVNNYYGFNMDFNFTFKSETDLINRYRDLANQPEIDEALEDILNEALIFDEKGNCVEINVDDIETSEKVKDTIRKEFKYILKILEFSTKGHEIFRKWYVDGRIYYHILFQNDNIQKGIIDVENIDPRKIKKIKEVRRERDASGIDVIKNLEEYYMYNEMGFINPSSKVGVSIKKDSIVFVPSGLLEPKRNQIISYLHKAIRPFNQLRLEEDSLVIYRLSRAPERRIFYVDVGTMSTTKANQYVRNLQQSFRNKLVYDATTGEIKDDKKFMSMLEDFWLPRREGGKGSEISTLPGGANLGDIEDVEYFRKKLYRSLNVPFSRFDQGSTGFVGLGRTNEITRDELKFSKFISKIRNRFTELFDTLLKVQLVTKKIITPDEWDEFKENIWYDFQKDINYEELKESELTRNRAEILTMIDPFVGKYYSREWVMSNLLKFDQEDIKKIDKEIDREVNDKSNPMSPDSPANPNFLQNKEMGMQQDQQDQQMGMQQDQQDMEKDKFEMDVGQQMFDRKQALKKPEAKDKPKGKK